MSKRKTIHLGTTSRGTRLIVPNELAGRRTLVVGMSGSGKSNTATVIMEQLIAAGEQLVMIDPKGEGWGLRSLADGTASNLDVILFGEPNADIEPLDETHGPRIADFVVQTGRSVVLSLLGFESDQAERRFVASFMRQLYRRKSKQANPTRMLVVIDEAHLFVPERPSGDQTELSGAIQRIARQGRSKGIGTLLIDQRPQDVAKRVITQCETIICHQLAHKLDRDALKDWIRAYDREGVGDAFLESLASLQPGEGWLWSPAWLSTFERFQANLRETFDAGAAPSGKKAARVQRAAVDLDKLRGELTEVIEKAEAEDPAKLRGQIAQLERERAQYTKANAEMGLRLTELEVQLRERPAEVEVQRVEVPAVDERAIKRIEDGGQALVHAIERMERVIDSTLVKQGLHRIQLVVDELKNLKERCNDRSQGRGDGPGRAAESEISDSGGGALRTAERRRGIRQVGGMRYLGADEPGSSVGAGRKRSDGDDHAERSGGVEHTEAIKPAHQRILDAIAWLNTAGIAQPHRSVVAAIAGTSSTSGFYNRNVGRLSSLGLVRYPRGGLIELTDAGGRLAQYPEHPGSRRDLHKAWMKCPAIKPAHARLLEALIDAHPDALTREQLAQAAGTTANSGFYNRNVGRLSSLGLAEYPQPGLVRATSLLFPEGLA